MGGVMRQHVARSNRLRWKIALAGLSICGAIAMVGCGKRYPTVPVRGRVSLDGGPLPSAGVIYFTPSETFGGHPLRPATASFEADGAYSVYSFSNTEGLFPGKYDVHVHCWKVPPTMDGPPAQSYLPPKYAKANTSELKLIVEEGSAAKEFNIDIPGNK